MLIIEFKEFSIEFFFKFFASLPISNLHAGGCISGQWIIETVDTESAGMDV